MSNIHRGKINVLGKALSFESQLKWMFREAEEKYNTFSSVCLAFKVQNPYHTSPSGKTIPKLWPITLTIANSNVCALERWNVMIIWASASSCTAATREQHPPNHQSRACGRGGGRANPSSWSVTRVGEREGRNLSITFMNNTHWESEGKGRCIQIIIMDEGRRQIGNPVRQGLRIMNILHNVIFAFHVW